MIQLNISIQHAKTELAIQKPAFTMKTTLPKIQIDAAAAKLDIKQTPGTLEIDMYPFRASYGMKNWADLTREFAEQGRSAALEAIGKIAANGDRLAHIENKETAVINIAAEESMPSTGELSWSWLEKPVINYTPQEPQVNYTPGKLDINLQRGTVETNYTPGKVGVNMLVYPAVHYSTSEGKVDLLA